MSNAPEQLVGWLNQISALRDMVIETFYEDSDGSHMRSIDGYHANQILASESTEALGIKTKLDHTSKSGDESDDGSEEDGSANKFVKELEMVQLHIFRAQVNYAYRVCTNP